jgi:hypothetical protein
VCVTHFQHPFSYKNTPHGRRSTMPVTAEDLLQQAIQRFQLTGVNTQTLLRSATDLAQQVNQIHDLRGREKMEIVQQTLRDALQHPTIRQSVTPELYVILMNTIKHVIPEAITLIINAGRGEFNFKKPSVGCIFSLLSCFGTAAAAMGAPQLQQLVSQFPIAPPPSPASEKEPSAEELKSRAESSSSIQIEMTSSNEATVSSDVSKPEPAAQ